MVKKKEKNIPLSIFDRILWSAEEGNEKRERFRTDGVLFQNTRICVSAPTFLLIYTAWHEERQENQRKKLGYSVFRFLELFTMWKHLLNISGDFLLDIKHIFII